MAVQDVRITIQFYLALEQAGWMVSRIGLNLAIEQPREREINILLLCNAAVAWMVLLASTPPKGVVPAGRMLRSALSVRSWLCLLPGTSLNKAHPA